MTNNICVQSRHHNVYRTQLIIVDNLVNQDRTQLTIVDVVNQDRTQLTIVDVVIIKTDLDTVDNR